MHVNSIILIQNMMFSACLEQHHVSNGMCQKGPDFLMLVSRNELEESTNLSGNFPPDSTFSMGMAEHLTLSITVPANIYHRRSKQKHRQRHL